MPTKRGWQVLSAAVGLSIVGRVFGIKELFELAMLLLLLVAVAVCSVVRRRPNLSVRRVVADQRPEQHTALRVTLTFHNHAKRASPLLRYVEIAPRSLGGRASVTIPPLKSGKTRSIPLVFKAVRRGIYELGPGILSKTEPFGLARWTYSSIEQTRIVVYPIAEDLDLVELGGDPGPGRGRGRMAHASVGREFYALRQFQEGDDRRKIHWPSTARLGKTMIRQEEQQSHLLVKVLIDPTGASSHEYERCIQSAASVVRSFSKRSHPTRLVDGPRPSAASGIPDTYHHAMERLAASSHHPETDTSYLWHELADGFIVFVCARPHAELVRRITRDRSLAARTLVIAHRSDGPASNDGRMETIRRAGSIAVEVPESSTLGSAWRWLDGFRSSRPLVR